jgi:CRISPR system Cascade subunit CasC
MSRFLQIHTLTSYPASLLNRDDVGFAKRIPFGGVERVRVSSQCLKRHWRTADSEHALRRIPVDDGEAPMAIRSRRTFRERLYDPLVAEGVPAEVAAAVCEALVGELLPKGKRKKAEPADDGGDAGTADDKFLRTEQVTVIGEPEVEYLRSLAREIAAGAADAKSAAKAAVERIKSDGKNLQTMRLGAGLDAALFGRMITGDILARCDAAIHVAHSMTVHGGFFETDYFSAVDDLQGPEETGSGHINTSELTSGLFYGYAVVDVPLLVSNLQGCPREAWRDADRGLAAQVVEHVIHLIATVSPGAKLGSTAPYAHAAMVLAESGSAQPRTLANAFLDPVRARGGLFGEALRGLGEHLAAMDRMYGRSTARRLAVIAEEPALLEQVDERLDLPGVARWAAEAVEKAG